MVVTLSEFVCFPCACMASLQTLQLLPTTHVFPQNMHVRLSGDFKLCGCEVVVCYDGLGNCPGCIHSLGQNHLGAHPK